MSQKNWNDNWHKGSYALSKRESNVKLILSKQLKDQIKFLCGKLTNREWSGVLFYKVVQGSLDKGDCVLKADYLYLQDVGDGVSTSYEFDERYIKFMMDNPEYQDYIIGHIHSHHNMDVFFSGTDSTEHAKNAEFHNYYLSLIVNNIGKMIARVAFQETIETVEKQQTIRRNIFGRQRLYKTQSEPVTKTVVNYYEVNMHTPEPKLPKVGEELIESLDYYIKKSARPIYSGSYSNYQGGSSSFYTKSDSQGYSYSQGSLDAEFDDETIPNWKTETKEKKEGQVQLPQNIVDNGLLFVMKRGAPKEGITYSLEGTLIGAKYTHDDIYTYSDVKNDLMKYYGDTYPEGEVSFETLVENMMDRLIELKDKSPKLCTNLKTILSIL